MIIRIFLTQGLFHFHPADAGDRENPAPPALESRGWKSKGEATRHAIDFYRLDGETVEAVSGSADKHVAREMGVRFLDPRKGAGKAGLTPSDLRRAAIHKLHYETAAGLVDKSQFRERFKQITEME